MRIEICLGVLFFCYEKIKRFKSDLDDNVASQADDSIQQQKKKRMRPGCAANGTNDDY